MKPITHEWVEKAEADLATAERELRARKNPNYDAVCFHSQQCAEKYLKARLQQADVSFGKTHDLIALLNLVLSLEASWEDLRADLQALTVFAVAYRYPGESADKATARESVLRCRKIRHAVRQSLGLR
jgi:HEPN domain-containing protein